MMGWLKSRARDNNTADIKVLMVCTANVCRSPLAEAILKQGSSGRSGLTKIHVDSCGLKAGPVPTAPDPRARAIAEKNGISLKGIKSRRFDDQDFYRFDWILAMDSAHLAELKSRCPEDAVATLSLFLPDVVGQSARDVPDPYYGTAAGFERVYDLLVKGCDYWLEVLQ